MTAFTYFLMLALVLGIAGVLDTAWLRCVRPQLAKRFGWREVQADEHIPASVWVGALATVSIIFIFLPHVGAGAGY